MFKKILLLTLLYCSFFVFSYGQCEDVVYSCNPNTGDVNYFVPIDMSTAVVQTDPDPTDLIGPDVHISNAGCDINGQAIDVVVGVEQLTGTNPSFRWNVGKKYLLHGGAANTWYRFTTHFYEAGTTNPINFNILQEITDIDGDCDYNDNGKDWHKCDAYDPNVNVNADYVQVLGYDWYATAEPTLVYHPTDPAHNYFLSAGVNNSGFSAITGVTPDANTQGVVFGWLNKSSLSFDYYAGGFGGVYVDYTTEFNVENGCLNLPVAFSDFTVQELPNNEVLVEWSVATESDGKEYQVEYSLDGVNFQLLSVVPSKGDTDSGFDYSYIHTNVDRLSAETIYYRVKFVEHSAEPTYTDIMAVNLKGGMSNAIVRYDSTARNIEIIGTKLNQAQIFDISGKQVRSVTLNPKEAIHQIDVSDFSAGVYLVTTDRISAKIIVN